MKLLRGGFNTWVYSRRSRSPNVRIVKAIGAQFISADEHPPTDLAKIVGNISLMYEATGIASVFFGALSVLGVNGIFMSTGVPAMGEPIAIDARRIMRNMVLDNHVICGTVNAGRASFEEAVDDLGGSCRASRGRSRSDHRPYALDDARDAVLTPGGSRVSLPSAEMLGEGA